MDQSKKGRPFSFQKGVHLVIDQSRFPLKQAVYFDTPDGRMVFAIPVTARLMWEPQIPSIMRMPLTLE